MRDGSLAEAKGDVVHKGGERRAQGRRKDTKSAGVCVSVNVCAGSGVVAGPKAAQLPRLGPLLCRVWLCRESSRSSWWAGVRGSGGGFRVGRQFDIFLQELQAAHVRKASRPPVAQPVLEGAEGALS